MTAKGTNSFAYDFEDRLKQSTINSTFSQYQYDGEGNRLAKTAGATTTRYVLDLNGSLSRVLAETDAANAVSAYYVYGLGLIARIQPNGAARYYHYDSRGSTCALSDGGGSITDRYAYDPFGAVANNEGATPNPFKYLGRHGVMDEGNGLQYIRARYYDPAAGRFISKDPKPGNEVDTQSLHRYVYAMNNPVRFIDITGLSREEVTKLAGPSDTDEFHAAVLSGGGGDANEAKTTELSFGGYVAGKGSSVVLEGFDAVMDSSVSLIFKTIDWAKGVISFWRAAKRATEETPAKVRRNIDVLSDPNSSDEEFNRAANQKNFYRDLYIEPGLSLNKAGFDIVY
jgi:RHS repeat-associated protein